MTEHEEREQNANLFAMHLLVPSRLLREEVRKLGPIDLAGSYDDSLRKLARIFKVSEAVIAFRLAEETHIQREV